MTEGRDLGDVFISQGTPEIAGCPQKLEGRTLPESLRREVALTPGFVRLGGAETSCLE